ncbi:MAG TPA: hypothetical protein VEL51_06670 [Vicinamibacterales bacterium]|nr:hypothetical protein [Vicinamibacterales bacterium]
MVSFAPLLLSAVLFTPVLDLATESSMLEAPTRHVRTMDRSIRSLMKRGFRHSPSFSALVAKLQHSDVLVYVEEVPRLAGALEGRLVMLPMAHGYRYVRIQIALRGSPDDSVAVLGHELQHAVEVAEAPEVQDQAGMMKLYERIGSRGGDHVYETAAAQQMARTVRRELSS